MEDPDLWREQHRFYNFLQHYDLQQYHQRFLEKGVSKVSHLKTVDEVCLEEIGLSRPERIRLMKKMEENFSLHGKLKKTITGKSGRFDAAAPDPYASPLSGRRSSSLKQDGEPDTHHTASLIAKEDVKLGKKIGEGAHGAVWEGLWSNVHGSVAVAIKTLYGKEEVQTQFIKEADSMRTLNHPNIIRLYGIVLSSPLMLIEELAPLGSLHQYLVTQGRKVSVRLFHSYACQIADAMKYLEERRIIHRDLATRNILLVSEDYVKLSDFGMARILDKHSDIYNLSNLQARIPVAWTAIEGLTRAKFSTASDIWSYGVTLWEIYSLGRTPWEGLSPIEIRDTLEGGDRLGRPERCSPQIYKILLACWEARPQDRFNFATICNRLQPLAPQLVRAIQTQTVLDDANSLSFKKGELIYIVDRPKAEWIFGMRANGEVGHFLAEHVTTEINPIGQLKEKVMSGKAKASELPISNPTDVTHDYHMGKDGKKWTVDGPMAEEQARPAGRRRAQPHGGQSSDGSRTSSQESNHSSRTSPSHDPHLNRSPSPRVPRGSAMASTVTTSTRALTTASPPPPPSPSSRAGSRVSQYSQIELTNFEQRYAPQATSCTGGGGGERRGSEGVEGVGRVGNGSFTNGGTAWNRSRSVGSESPTRRGSFGEEEDGSASSARPDYCSQQSEDNEYISMKGMLKISELKPLVEGAAAGIERERDDEGYEYLKMEPNPTGLQRPVQGHHYENWPQPGNGQGTSGVVSLGQFRDDIPAYAVSKARDEIPSSESGSETNPFSPTPSVTALEDMSHVNPATLPRPLIPYSVPPRLEPTTSPRFPVAMDGLTPSTVAFMTYSTGDGAFSDSNPFLRNEALTSPTAELFSTSEPACATSRPIHYAATNQGISISQNASGYTQTNFQNGQQSQGPECNLQRSASLDSHCKLQRSPGQRKKKSPGERGGSTSPVPEVEELVARGGGGATKAPDDYKLHRSPGQRRRRLGERGRSTSPINEGGKHLAWGGGNAAKAPDDHRPPLPTRATDPELYRKPRGMLVIPTQTAAAPGYDDRGPQPAVVPDRPLRGTQGLEAVLMSEFPETSPELCKQALEVHYYDIRRARREVKVHLLLGMQIPYITTEDCRRAIMHCQEKVDRAAEWLLGQSEEIAAKRA